MDYAIEINNLKKRIEDLENCWAEFRSCKDKMAVRLGEVERL